MRNYAAISAAQSQPTPSMIEAQRAYHDEIPFGIRALESGVEVAGVWISQSNTPAPSCLGSPASIAVASPASSGLEEPDFGEPFSIDEPLSRIEVPPPVRPAVRSTWSGTRLPTLNFNRDRSTARAVSTASLAYSQQSYISSRTRPSSLPTRSLLRYSITMDSMDSSSFMEHNAHRGMLLDLPCP
jgi:hypothetical protein